MKQRSAEKKRYFSARVSLSGERVDNAFRSAKCLIFWERLDQPELSDETAATLELLKQRVYGELTPDTTVTAAGRGAGSVVVVAFLKYETNEVSSRSLRN